jgi:hypothetical protein
MPLGSRKFLAGKGSGATDDTCIITFSGSSGSGITDWCRDAGAIQDPAGYVLNVRNFPDEFSDPNYPAVVILRPGITYRIRWYSVNTLQSFYDATNYTFQGETGRYKASFGSGRNANGYNTPVWDDTLTDFDADNLYPLQYTFTNITFPETIQENFTVTTAMVNNNQGLYGNYYITSGGNPNSGGFSLIINEAIV